MRAFVPPGQLLVFDVKEGWAPLCHFLELPVPDIPFPNINDANEIRLCCIRFQVSFRGLLLRYACLLIKLLSWGGILLLGLLLAFALNLLINSQTTPTDILQTGHMQGQMGKVCCNS